MNNEQLLTLLLQGATDGVHILDESGNVVEASDSFAETLGYSRKEIIGMNVCEWDAKWSRTELLEERLPELFNSAKRAQFDTLHRRKNGSIFPVEVSLQPMTIGARRFLHCSSRDISSRLEAQEALRISEEQFRSSFECGASGMALVAPEGRLLKANLKFCEIVGYSESELLRMEFPQFSHPDDIEADLALANRVLTGEISSYQMKKRYVHKQGHIVRAHIGVSLVRKSDGSPLYFVGQCQDITAQELAEAKVRENEERFSYALNATGEGVWDWDIVSNRVKHNRRWSELLDLNDGTLEHPIADSIARIHADDHAQIMQCMQAAWRDGTVYESEFRVRKSDGSYIWVLDRGGVVEKDASGNPTRMIGSLKDVSALKTAQVQLVQTSKMASLGEMAAGIAHEINNPLLVILGKTYQMRSRLQQDPADHKSLVPLVSPASLISDLDKIETTVDRISKIVRGLQLFSRSSEKDPMLVSSLSGIVSDTMELCRERFKFNDVDMKISIDADFKLRCRPGQISQVLMNLLSNSFDAVDKQTQKWIELRAEEIRPGHVRISITDSGKGIAPDIAGRIMDPFFTTKEIGRGTGLGLSISRGIIEEHFGQLFYDDTCAHTRFVIELPCSGVRP